MLPPTTPELKEPSHRPYFLWWTDATVAELHRHLADPDLDRRAYWLGALLREANSRDVWLFATRAEIEAMWPRLARYLGKSRARWAWLLDLPLTPWPPPEAHANRL